MVHRQDPVATRSAPAKINLCLHVTGRRADGYHLLHSLVVFATIADRVSVIDDDDLSLTVNGPMAALAGPLDDNLVLRAARALQQTTGTRRGARLVLDKQLPAGAGLGGGSSDAAAALILLNQIWDCGLERDQISAIGLKLGADLPVCLAGQPAWLSGIGEHIDPIGFFPSMPIVLIHPGGNLSTKDVFTRLNGHFGPKAPDLPPELDGLDGLDGLCGWLDDTRNDLQAPAMALRPDISDPINALGNQDNCLIARMSGSGASSFGLFRDDASARHACHELQTHYPGWWIRHGLITGVDLPKD